MADAGRTVVYDKHIAGGAQMVDFAGWLMPVRYADGIVAEHLATRKRAGLFDVSHMGRIVFRGAGSLLFLQYVLTSDVSKLVVGRSQYTMLANESGGAVDDAYLYRFVEDEYLLVVNAANREKDIVHFRRCLACFKDVEMTDVSDRLAMISLQGPASDEILAGLVDRGAVPEKKRNSLSIVSACGVEVLVGRTGYTGEPVCFELMAPSEAAGQIWEALVARGAKPVGLGGRDTLRLEAGLPLYGHELGIDNQGREIPIFACPLAGFAVSFSDEKGDFIGKGALQRQYGALQRLEKGDSSAGDALPRRIRQIAVTGRGIARQGAAVMFEGGPVGCITSGTMVPYWKVADTCQTVELTEESGMRALAMGLLDSEVRVGDEIEIDIRGRPVAAKVVGRNLNNRTTGICIPLIYR